MAITERLEQIQCGCERSDLLREFGRPSLVDELNRLGFGRTGQAIPTDWRTYYSDEELREFILSYANDFTPAA